MKYTPATALLELSLQSAEACQASFEDVVLEGLDQGIPAELLTRLKDLWDETRVVGRHAVAVGRVIVLKIVEFIKANPHLAVGLALGAAVGFLAAGAVPWVGALLQPLATLLAALYGMGIAAARGQGVQQADPISAAIALAKEFFALLLAVLDGVSVYFEPGKEPHGAAG